MEINQMYLTGVVHNEPKVNELKDGTMVVDIFLRHETTRTDKSGTEQTYKMFIPVKFWGDTAKRAARFCKTDATILVEGVLQNYKKKDETYGFRVYGRAVVPLGDANLAVVSSEGDYVMDQAEEITAQGDVPF